jgi:putative hemolysin
MPKDFTNCVKNGGKVRRKNLKNGKYINICYDKNGNSHAGEVKVKKKTQSNKEAQVKQIKESRELAKSLLDLQEYFHNNYRMI